MQEIDKELGRYLNLLRHFIRRRGFTQLEIQQSLGWGRSYISQLLTAQKSLRFEQLLQILNAMDVKPAEFFLELYQLDSHPGPRGYVGHGATRSLVDDLESRAPAAKLRRLRLLTEGLVALLKQKGLITTDDLTRAIEKARRQPDSR